MFLDNAVVVKNSIYICILVFCFNFSSDVIARKIRVSELLYLKVALDEKSTGEDAKIFFVGSDQATDFTVETVKSSNWYVYWDKRVVFVAGKSFNIPLLEDKNFFLGCDSKGALKMFLYHKSLTIETMPETIKKIIVWDNIAYCLRGSVLVATILKLGERQLIVEHPLLDIESFE